uniref:Uncharacterized protein n=1 Tax=Meloidogyne incognita TaxID=6306 RepID=A0A914MJ95_MELIC
MDHQARSASGRTHIVGMLAHQYLNANQQQMSLNNEHWCSSNLAFLKDNTTTTVQYPIDTTNGCLWTLYFNQIDWLFKDGSIKHTTCRWNDLTTTTVNCVSVKSHIVNIKTNTTHILITHYTFLGCPLESCYNRILKILNSFCHVNQKVCSSPFRSKTPNFTSISCIKFIFFSKNSCTIFWIISRADFSTLNCFR